MLPFGAVTVFNEDINRSLKEEFTILIMGPIFQIIFTFIFKDNEILLNYSKILLIFNLLPIYPLDGSKLVNICLNILLSFKKSHLITMYISLVTIFAFIIKTQFNLLFTLSIVFILIKIIEQLKTHESIFNRFLLERYSKNYHFKKRKIIKSLNINKMKRDYTHIFYDKNKWVTEREILQKRFDFHRKK